MLAFCVKAEVAELFVAVGDKRLAALLAARRRTAKRDALRAAAADADLGVRLHSAVTEHAVRREKNVK